MLSTKPTRFHGMKMIQIKLQKNVPKNDVKKLFCTNLGDVNNYFWGVS